MRAYVVVVIAAGCGRIGFDSAGGGDASIFAGPDACALTPDPANQRAPSASNAAGGFVVAWEDDRSGASEIYATHLTAAGAVIDLDGIPITTGGTNPRHGPAIAANVTEAFVAWREDSGAPGPDIYGAMLRTDTVIAPFDLSGGGFTTGTRPRVASNGGTFMVAWGNQGGGSDLAGAIISGGGLAGPAFAICPAVNGQDHAAVTSGSGYYFVAWQDDRNAAPDSDIFAARIDSGVVLDCIPVSTNATNELQPAVTFALDTFGVVWGDNRGADPDIYGARVSPDGTVLDPLGQVFTAAPGVQSKPATSSAATRTLVAWIDSTANVVQAEVYDDTTHVGGPVLVLPSQGTSPQEITTAVHDGEFLVVAETTGASSGQDLEGWFVTGDSIVHGPFAIVGSCN